MSLTTLLILHFGIGSALAWLRHQEGERLAALPLTLLAWPLDFIAQCLVVVHETSQRRLFGAG